MPGLIVTQQSGEGKANQYFVRGFNLDIPELVDHLDYQLGVSRAALGDFGSAGGAEFHLARTLDRPFATVETGATGLGRFASGASTHVGPGDPPFGGELKSYDGPWARAERISKRSGLARYSWTSGTSHVSPLAMAYQNHWDSNDQVAERAVDDGAISRNGQIDSTDGGRTRRSSLSGEWQHLGRASVQTVQVYGIRSALTLFSDFT